MKMVHAITNGDDPSSISLGGGDGDGEERKLSLAKSSNIGQMGTVDGATKRAELKKILAENSKVPSRH